MLSESATDQELMRAFLARIGKKKARQVAREVPGVTADDVSRWRRNKWEYLTGEKRAVLLRYLTQPDAQVEGNGASPPEFVRPEWVPKLIERVLELPDVSAEQRERLMAQVNAAAVHFWAISAEWAGGQRGIAVQQVAQANRAAEESARARARTLGREEREEATELSEQAHRLALDLLEQIREEERQQAARAASQSGAPEKAAS